MELETGNITVTEYPCPMCGQLMPMRAHATTVGRVVGRCQNLKCLGLGRDVIEFDTSARDELLDLPGVDKQMAANLHNTDIHTWASVSGTPDEVLLSILGLGEKTLLAIRNFLADDLDTFLEENQVEVEPSLEAADEPGPHVEEEEVKEKGDF